MSPPVVETVLGVPGANCPWCMNDAVAALRAIDGVRAVHASMTDERIRVVHTGTDIGALLHVLQSTLHGSDASGYGTRMVAIDPVVPGRQCHHRAVGPDRGEGPAMETLTGAMQRLRREGYEHEFSSIADGHLACSACGRSHAPDDLTVRVTVRFEGDSNPDDEDILLGLACRCGALGQFSAAYGMHTPANDAGALQGLGNPRSVPGLAG